ncbi:MAG: hypothetical protein H6Q15_547 [Bacteroidetes bacterium]|nr:hypothetical protein [Bacteroidota bacterium]
MFLRGLILDNKDFMEISPYSTKIEPYSALIE